MTTSHLKITMSFSRRDTPALRAAQVPLRDGVRERFLRPKNPHMVEPYWLNHVGDPSPHLHCDEHAVPAQVSAQDDMSEWSAY